MLRVLNTLQFFQKKLQIGLCNYKLPDAVFHRIVVFTDVIIYDKFFGAVVVSKALRNQKRPLCEFVWEVLAEIENQVRRRTAAIVSVSAIL